jgi:hypothetical protein
MTIHDLMDVEQLRRKIREPVRHPTALAAALSEILSCEQYPQYFQAILREYPDASPFDAVFKHAVRRARASTPFMT